MKIVINPFKICFLATIFIVYCIIIIRNSKLIIHEFQVIECRSNVHSKCVLNMLVCHPGYIGENCCFKLEPINNWFTINCPNLNKSITYDHRMSTDVFKKLDEETYMCFLHPDYGIPQLPISLWKLMQQSESHLKKQSYYIDKGTEILEGFDNYKSLPIINLGHFLEIRCGPYTQTQFIIDYTFKSITLLDRLANSYLKNFSNCSYKNNTLFGKNVKIISHGFEKLINESVNAKYDTIMSINGIEDSWDGYQFLINIYNALKPGGVLIFHEKFFPFSSYSERVNTKKGFHPVRLTKIIYDHFLSKFKKIYKFEGQTIAQIKSSTDEMGFYFIGIKL